MWSTYAARSSLALQMNAMSAALGGELAPQRAALFQSLIDGEQSAKSQ